MKPKVFSSSTTGTMELFKSGLRDREQTMSITFDDGFNFDDTSDFRVYMQIEPPEVVNCLGILIERHNHYDLILAWHENVLKACPNAVLFPQALCTWIDKCYHSHTWNPKTQEKTQEKTQNEDHSGNNNDLRP